jgi:hypothetical protein
MNFMISIFSNFLISLILLYDNNLVKLYEIQQIKKSLQNLLLIIKICMQNILKLLINKKYIN